MLTGEWSGIYGYSGNIEKNVNFFARLRDKEGNISGDISEPNESGVLADFLYAHINGHHNGQMIQFTKTYDGSGDFAHSVFYDGLIENDGHLITGSWKIDILTGWFKMVRENSGPLTEEEIEEETEIEIEETVNS